MIALADITFLLFDPNLSKKCSRLPTPLQTEALFHSSFLMCRISSFLKGVLKNNKQLPQRMSRSERVKLQHQSEGLKADPRAWVEAAGKHNPDGTLLSLVIGSRAWNVCRENTVVCAGALKAVGSWWGLLFVLRQDFRDAVAHASRQLGKPVIEDRILNQILYYLPQLYELNRDLLRELEERLSHWWLSVKNTTPLMLLKFVCGA